ncbi:IS200/IS605 family transposase [Pseudoclavibacter soli]|uniref:IS200/IS605 family transposase n=1 Tax=Pseudoclavibacter soli TaxID=452623 RepID=UPI000427ACD0|nr:IS200/IS605 family transposase [Pseudoclavibacter soli]
MGSKTVLKYHLILTTKYRRPALAGIEQSVYQAIRAAEELSEFKILAMQIEHGNHIHLAIRTPPNYSISSLVNRIKAISTTRLWDTEAEHLRHHYWGTRHKLWHGAYWCSTTGNVSSATVLDYIKHQDGPSEHTQDPRNANPAIHRRS